MNHPGRILLASAVAASFGIVLLTAGAARADTSDHEAFNATPQVVQAGPPALIEIRVDAVTALAHLTLTSSRGTLSLQTCELAALPAGASRTCRLFLTAPAAEKYLTLKLTVELAPEPGALPAEPRLEQHGFTFANPAYDAGVKKQSTPSRLQAR